MITITNIKAILTRPVSHSQHFYEMTVHPHEVLQSDPPQTTLILCFHVMTPLLTFESFFILIMPVSKGTDTDLVLAWALQDVRIL